MDAWEYKMIDILLKEIAGGLPYEAAKEELENIQDKDIPGKSNNPYALYENDLRGSVQKKITVFLKELISDFSEEKMKEITKKIRELYKLNVGVGDTPIDESICEIFKKMYKREYKVKGKALEQITENFYELLHWG